MNSVNNNDFLIVECFVRWEAEAISESSLMEEAVSSFLVTKSNFFGFGNKQFETFQTANLIPYYKYERFLLKSKKCFLPALSLFRATNVSTLVIDNSKLGFIDSRSHEFF